MIDRDSETWMTVKAWANQQRQAARAALEAPGCDPRTADELRGSIAKLSLLLGLERPHAPLSEPARQSGGDRSGY